MIDKLLVSRAISRPMITGVSYLRGYISLRKSQRVSEITEDRIFTKYFDQLFYKNYINENMISALRPALNFQRIDNLSYFVNLQGLMDKLQQNQDQNKSQLDCLQVIQEELKLHQEVFYKRLQEGAL